MYKKKPKGTNEKSQIRSFRVTFGYLNLNMTFFFDVSVMLNCISTESQNIPLPWICIIVREQAILRHSSFIILKRMAAKAILRILLGGYQRAKREQQPPDSRAITAASNNQTVLISLFHQPLLIIHQLITRVTFRFAFARASCGLYQPSLKCRHFAVWFRILRQSKTFSLFITFFASIMCAVFIILRFCHEVSVSHTIRKNENKNKSGLNESCRHSNFFSPFST